MAGVILHIGARKCGSTSIQKYLAHNNAALNARGVHYLAAARMGPDRGDGHYAHHYAAAVHKHGFAYWDDILREIEQTPQCRTFILSSEIFHALAEADVRRIRELLEGFDVRVLFVTRDRMDFLKSEYKQQIKLFDEARPFAAFAEDNLELSDFDGHRRRWAGVFGAERVEVIDFDRYRGGDPARLVEAFCERAGIDLPVRLEEMENVSVGDRRSVILRRINRVAAGAGAAESRLVHHLKNSIRRGRTVGNVFCRIADPFVRSPLIPPDEEQAVRERFLP